MDDCVRGENLDDLAALPHGMFYKDTHIVRGQNHPAILSRTRYLPLLDVAKEVLQTGDLLVMFTIRFIKVLSERLAHAFVGFELQLHQALQLFVPDS